MSDSKLTIKVGLIEFTGEGESVWLSAQLDKVISKIPDLLKTNPVVAVVPKAADNDPAKKDTSKLPNLALFLKDKSATVVQTKKFLATAAHIQLSGSKRQTTADVSKALKDSNQTKLNNPSDCLNQNVSKGHCEKDGANGYFVTDSGLAELGIVL